VNENAGEADRLAAIAVCAGEDAFADLADDLRARPPRRVVLVSDENTFGACGQRVEEAVGAAGIPLKKVVFPGRPWLAADEASLAQVLLALDGQESLLAAVGSGTITDVVRLVAYQARLPFVSVPTAASVDAYASYTASISLSQVKYSLPAGPSQAIYAHLPTLWAAPCRMTASGFSDMVAKYTALADWKLAHLLVREPYHVAAARQAEQAVESCASRAAAIRDAQPEGITALFGGLLTSGRCMLTVRSSRPAAGSEHSLAHFWEIRHRQHHLTETLHGEKAGVAAVVIARLYEGLRCLTRQEAAHRLSHFTPPDPAAEAGRLCAALGPAAEAIVSGQASFLGGLGRKVDQVKANLLAHWEQIQAIAATVPAADTLAGLLESAGALSRPEQLEVEPGEVQQALETALYIRDRLTILELSRMLGLL
jgi:glycerol-1-phosphate dehydrogenase [NAD(P)+]